MSPIPNFLRDLDRRWKPLAPAKTELRMLGSAALMLQVDYVRATKDADVLETIDVTRDVRSQLWAIAGKGSELHATYRLYLDVVANGLPFFPQIPVWHPHPLSAELQHFTMSTLDVLDVVVTKLVRFSGADRADVDAMVQRRLVPHDRLLDRFRSAVDWLAMDARAERDLPKCVRNLHFVEREMLGVDPTEITLPGWL